MVLSLKLHTVLPFTLIFALSFRLLFTAYSLESNRALSFLEGGSQLKMEEFDSEISQARLSAC